MEFLEFAFKIFSSMLPRHFNNYFRSLETIHDHNIRRKAKKDFFFHTYAETNWSKNMIAYNFEVLIYGKMY